MEHAFLSPWIDEYTRSGAASKLLKLKVGEGRALRTFVASDDVLHDFYPLLLATPKTPCIVEVARETLGLVVRSLLVLSAERELEDFTANRHTQDIVH
jgi:hypothetical protein